MRVLPAIFRAYDIRGFYPSQINEPLAYAIGRNFTRALRRRGRVVVGRDARRSSPSLERAFKQGLREAGFKIVCVGVITSPSLIFFVHHFRTCAGVIITASHNPVRYNGIKIIMSDSNVVGGSALLKRVGVTALESAVRFYKKKRTPVLCVNRTAGALDKYAAFLVKKADVQRPLKVIIDASNGTAALVVRRIFGRIKNIVPVFLNAVVDSRFAAHGPDPTKSFAQRQASQAVRKHHADLGVIFDGDGDRAIFCDDKGKTLHAHQVWRLLVAGGKVRSSVHTAVDTFAVRTHCVHMRRAGIQPPYVYEGPVGRSFVPSLLKRHRADIGFEYSGHYYFKDFFWTDSGLMAALRVCSALSRLPYALSDFESLLSPLVWMPQAAVRCSRRRALQILAHVRRRFTSKGRISTKSGVSVDMEDIWFNVRLSNTEDVLRINVAGVDKNRCGSLQKKLVRLVRSLM